MQGVKGSRVWGHSQVDAVTFEEAAIAGSAVVIHVQAAAVRADVCQVRHDWQALHSPCRFTKAAWSQAWRPLAHEHVQLFGLNRQYGGTTLNCDATSS